MQPDARDPASLADMPKALRKISDRLAGKTLDDFQADELLLDAVVRQFTILGEAARRVSPETRAADPSIPWTAIIGMRNIVVHEYDDVDTGELWRAFVKEIPTVMQRVGSLLRSLDEAPDSLDRN